MLGNDGLLAEVSVHLHLAPELTHFTCLQLALLLLQQH